MRRRRWIGKTEGDAPLGQREKGLLRDRALRRESRMTDEDAVKEIAFEGIRVKRPGQG